MVREVRGPKQLQQAEHQHQAVEKRQDAKAVRVAAEGDAVNVFVFLS